MSCRFETYDAAECRWNAAGAAGVRAQAGHSHSICDGDRAAGCRAAGNATRRAIEWAERRAVVRIQAQAGVGELRHVVAADENKSSGAQASDDGRVAKRGWLISQEARAGGCDFASDIE